MYRLAIICICIAALSVGCALVAVGQLDAGRPGNLVPVEGKDYAAGRVLVAFDSDVTAEDADFLHARIGGKKVSITNPAGRKPMLTEWSDSGKMVLARSRGRAYSMPFSLRGAILGPGLSCFWP